MYIYIYIHICIFQEVSQPPTPSFLEKRQDAAPCRSGGFCSIYIYIYTQL